MIGTTIRHAVTGEAFTITAQHGGAFIATPHVFGSPVALGVGELTTDYAVADATEPEAPDEQAGWDALAAVNHENATGTNRAAAPSAPPPTVEEVFAAIEKQEDEA